MFSHRDNGGDEIDKGHYGAPVGYERNSLYQMTACHPRWMIVRILDSHVKSEFSTWCSKIHHREEKVSMFIDL